MRAAQLHGGQVLVVLDIHWIVITHRRALVAGENRQGVQRVVAEVVRRAGRHPFAGAGGVDLEQPVIVVTGDAGGFRRGASPAPPAARP